MKRWWPLIGYFVLVLYCLTVMLIITHGYWGIAGHGTKTLQIALPEREQKAPVVVKYKRRTPSGNTFYMDGWTCSSPCID